jgi:hypothetical protein
MIVLLQITDSADRLPLKWWSHNVHLPYDTTSETQSFDSENIIDSVTFQITLNNQLFHFVHTVDIIFRKMCRILHEKDSWNQNFVRIWMFLEILAKNYHRFFENDCEDYDEQMVSLHNQLKSEVELSLNFWLDLINEVTQKNFWEFRKMCDTVPCREFGKFVSSAIQFA